MSTIKTTFIYALLDPITKEIKYIGKSNNPEDRFRRHLYELNRYLNGKIKNYHKINWLLSLKNKNLKPELKILLECPINEWSDIETKLIEQYKSDGYNLVNTTVGGLGGCGMRGKKLSEEHKQKISKSLTGRKFSNETLAKMGQSFKGKKLSEEHKQKISKSLTGRKISNETKQKISSIKIGKKLSKRHKMQLSNAKINNSNRAVLTWSISSPTGEIFKVKNLSRFCKDNNLSYAIFYRASMSDRINKPITNPKYFGWVILDKY